MRKPLVILLAWVALFLSVEAQIRPDSVPATEPVWTEVGRSFLRNFSPKEYKAHGQNWAVVQDHRTPDTSNAGAADIHGFHAMTDTQARRMGQSDSDFAQSFSTWL